MESKKSVTDLKAHYEELHKSQTELQTKKKVVSPAKKKAKARKIFQKFDTDGSGDIDVKEFQVLAFELGLPLTDTEAQDFIKAIDKDGNGTIDFEEFYTWWSSPDKNLDSSSPERAKQLQVLKIKLRSKALLKNASVLTTNLAKGAEKAKSLSDSTINSYDLEIFTGELKDIGSSVRLSHCVSAEEAGKVRAVAKAGENTVVVLVNVLARAGVDPFELGEIGGSVKAILDLAKEELKYHSFNTNFSQQGEKALFQLAFTFSAEQTPELEAANAIIEALKISRLSATWESSDKIGVPTTGYAAARFQLKAEVDRTVLLELAGSLSGEEKKSLIMFAGLRRAHFSVHFADLNTILTPDLYPELHQPNTPHSYQEARNLFVGPLAEILTNDELPGQFVELYEQSLKLLSGLDSIKIALGTNVFSLELEGFNIFDGYLPTIASLKEVKNVSTPPSGFELADTNIETDGGELDGYSAIYATISNIESLVYSSTAKQNINLLLVPSNDAEWMVTNLFVRAPGSGFTSPVRHVAFWVLADKPSGYAEYDKYNDLTQEKYDADSSSTKPVAFVEVPKYGAVQVTLDKWAKGKFVYAKLIDAWGEDNIDLEYIGFAGFNAANAPTEYKIANAAQILHLDNFPSQDLTELGISF